MSVQVVGSEALTRLAMKFKGLASGPTADEWGEIGDTFARVMAEDNRKGILSGTDKDDRRMPELKYRMGKVERVKARKGKHLGHRVGTFKGATAPTGFGGVNLANNNLTTKEYQRLTGPRLAPRGDESRSIANYVLSWKIRLDPGNRYVLEAMGEWKDVLTPEGEELLPIHFEGLGTSPKYDLRGVRRWGMAKLRTDAAAWFRRMISHRVGR